MNGNLTSPFCVSLKRLNNEICQFPLKLDELGKPTVDFSNVVWIVRLIQVRNGWSRRIALRALLSSQTLERTREQDKLIMDALSAGVSVSPVTPPPPKLGERARHVSPDQRLHVNLLFNVHRETTATRDRTLMRVC